MMLVRNTHQPQLSTNSCPLSETLRAYVAWDGVTVCRPWYKRAFRHISIKLIGYSVFTKNLSTNCTSWITSININISHQYRASKLMLQISSFYQHEFSWTCKFYIFIKWAILCTIKIIISWSTCLFVWWVKISLSALSRCAVFYLQKCSFIYDKRVIDMLNFSWIIINCSNMNMTTICSKYHAFILFPFSGFFDV